MVMKSRGMCQAVERPGDLEGGDIFIFHDFIQETLV